MPRIIASNRDLHRVEQAIREAPQPYRLMFTILRETGMRASEVCTLQVRDVVLEPGREQLWVRGGKTGDRVVTLTTNTHGRTLRGLRAYLKQIGDRPLAAALFLSNRQTQVSYDALEYQWQQALTQAALTDAHGKARYTLHQLRHTRATELLEAGLRLEDVQRVLGHKSIKSTQVYAAISDTVLRERLMDVRLPKRQRSDG
ncbi:MAG: site-specific integrase [Chloroflexaceae bacterium]|nr:site-specific integrase [Chloroflexaceae bacterium]